MTGWLIVNEYLNTEKFLKLYELFFDAAISKGIELTKYTNADFVVRCDENKVYSSAFSKGIPDFVIFYDKDIVLAKALEDMGLKVFNSSEAIKICDSKLLMGLAVSVSDTIGSSDISYKINTPKTFAVPFTYENIGIKPESQFAFLDEIEKQICYPIIIKESYSSFGMGVHFANNRNDAEKILCRVGNRECVIQEYVGREYKKAENECSDGDCEYPGLGSDSISSKDIRLQMVGDKCVAAMMRSNDKDFRANLTNGGKMSHYEPKPEEIELAKNVMSRLGLDFAGIDIMFDKDNFPVLCEANSNAHFKNLYDLTGINTAEYIFDYIEDKLRQSTGKI